MDANVLPQGADPLEKAATERREFLAAAARFAGVLAALGITGDAWTAAAAEQKVAPGAAVQHKPFLQGTERTRFIRSVLEDAIKSGDAQGALRKAGADGKLAPADISKISSLTGAELQAINSVKLKIPDLGAGADTGGIIY
ncbi:MAG TPA: hypothetical protein PLB01_11650 [Thermoanaerobaculia bacterium]|nr:hypothetical protein [Thermoanaerobaculia bacterium]